VRATPRRTGRNRCPTCSRSSRRRARGLQTDNERQRSYIYVETQRERKLDGKGGVRSESVKVVESYPPLPGEDERWERVLEEDGKRKTAAGARKAGCRAAEDRRGGGQAAVVQAPGDRDKATRDYDKSRKEALDRINDLFIVYDIKMAGRERIDGHDTIALTLEPKPNPRPRRAKEVDAVLPLPRLDQRERTTSW
jgi:hypothetical protein